MYNRYCFVITLNYIQIESALFPERELDNNNIIIITMKKIYFFLNALS